MSRKQSIRARVAIAAAALLAAALPASAAAAGPVVPTGAPEKAEVRMEALVGVPPQGYSLVCNGLSGCSTAGNIDLATEAELDAVLNERSGKTRGVGEMPFTSTEGDVSMTYDCGDGLWKSEIAVSEGQPGELEVSEITNQPGTNALSVRLDAAGADGRSFPREVTDRSDGGCSSPIQELTQTMGTWYYHFYLVHKPEQVENADLRIGNLAWKDGVFTRTFDRFVNVGFGSNTYPVYERTTLEVEPEYCAGKEHRIVSATANGESLGLDGMRFYPGQVVDVPAGAKMRLGDGSVIKVDEGTSFEIDECETSRTKILLTKDVGNMWFHVKKALGVDRRKFDVVTERAVAGVRGTIFEVSYDESKELTRVGVEESSVYLKGRNGAKGKVILEAGQVGVQKGKQPPRIVEG